MNNPSIKTTIMSRIEESPEQSVFFLNDFSELGSIETVRKVFLQARMLGMLSHVSHGIYVKPMKSRFGEVPPSMEIIAKEIAERDHVIIMPTGNTAANIVGLSTQVPMVSSYLTTGSSRTVKVGNRAIKFKHAAPRNFAYKGKTIPLIVQALKELKEGNIDRTEISIITKYLHQADDKDTFADDILIAPKWIQDIVKPIIKNLKTDETLATIQLDRAIAVARYCQC